MVPNAADLLQILDINTPLIGLYDAPDTQPFEPCIQPEPGQRSCVFNFYKQWLAGKTLLLTGDNFGCPGGRHWLGNVPSRSRQDFVKFLVDEEGLKASHDLMQQWLDHCHGYQPTYPHLLIGPLRDHQYHYLKTVSFYVNPDQLSMLLTGAQYDHTPGNPPPVITPFGSGCMQLISLFEDIEYPQAIIGATDIAMRSNLPRELLAFTVTKPMFEQLCTLDERSFLYKRFWRNLCHIRKKTEV